MSWPKIVHLVVKVNGILMRGSVTVTSWADIRRIIELFKDQAAMDIEIEQPDEETDA